MRWTRSNLSLTCPALLFTVASLAAPKPLTPNDVLQHLNRTITWYQHVAAADQAQTAPENLLLQDNVLESSRRALELAFTFARAEAAVLQASGQDTTITTAAAPIENRTLQQAALTANQRVAALQARIQSLNQQIEKATGLNRATLVSQRDTFAAYLQLATQSQQAIRNMLAYANGPNTDSPHTSLLNQINELANSDSLPSALNENQKPPSTTARVPEPFHPESAGILSLLARSTTLQRSSQQIRSLIKESNALFSQVDALKVPGRADLRAAINDGNAIVSAADTQKDPAKLAAATQQINDLAARFKDALNVMTPLGEEGIALENARSRLQDWLQALAEQNKTVLRYLAVRIAVVLFAVALIFILAAVWHKGIQKYVREPRRRRQLMLVRRLVIGCAVSLVTLLGFFTSFGSLGTIVGFMTAGIALALQNVLLSVVAYFFLIGRYGLRVGDRITVSGVTGQVVEIGLVRFFMMELVGTGADLQPTGRIAAWANSMIFQPYSWLKQAPGTEYAWHLVTLTVAPEADCELARDRVTSAVNFVFEDYRHTIEQQHATFEQSLNVQMPAPRPITRTHVSDRGCEIFIRYPVEFDRGGEIDEKVLERLLNEIEREPQLKLASGGAPKLRLFGT